MSKATIITLGCPKNKVDSELIAGGLKSIGFDLTNNIDQSDLVIINTCGFIEPAKVESIDTILEVTSKRTYDSQLFIVTGCLVERYAGELRKELPEVDYFLGLNSWPQLQKIIRENFNLQFSTLDYLGNLSRVIDAGASAYLKISEGCSRKCSYCAIPQIRGPHRSRSQKEILDEARLLIDNGIKEIVVIGQDTSAYGCDIDSENNLISLLSGISALEGQFWLRVMYLNPDNFDDGLIEIMKKRNNICRYFDLPVQHFSPDILDRMNRKNRLDNYLNLYQKIRTELPGAVIRSNVIIGFPGETEKDFKILVEAIKEAALDYLGIFNYSREEGTIAYDYSGQVDDFVIRERAEQLFDLQIEIVEEKIKDNFIGPKEMLIEQIDITKLYLSGRIKEQAPEIDGLAKIRINKERQDDFKIGQFIPVEINDFNCYDLEGIIT